MADRIEPGDYVVVCQRWEESERGWGVRPDGFSLHIHPGDREAFIERHWDELPVETPDEYDRPSGEPFEVGVSEAEYEGLAESGGSRRYYNSVVVPS